MRTRATPLAAFEPCAAAPDRDRLESKKQMKWRVYPDIIVGCIGGGSNFAGMFLPS